MTPLILANGEPATDKQIAIMQAVFDLHDAIDEEATTEDILDVMRASIKDGQEMLMIRIAMVAAAVNLLVEERRAAL